MLNWLALSQTPFTLFQDVRPFSIVYFAIRSAHNPKIFFFLLK